MRKLLLAVAVMAAASTAQADFVIDDFHLAGTNNSFGGPGAVDVFSDGSDAGTKTGTRSIVNVSPSTAFTTVSYGGGNFEATGTADGSTFTIRYDLDNPVDLHSAGNFPGSPLVLDLFDTVTGSWNLDVVYSDGTNTESIMSYATIDAAGLVGINGADFGNGALASAVTDIDLVFTVNTRDTVSGVATFGNANASVRAVPEPATMALLGLTGLVGGFVYRRRRKNDQAA